MPPLACGLIHVEITPQLDHHRLHSRIRSVKRVGDERTGERLVYTHLKSKPMKVCHHEIAQLGGGVGGIRADADLRGDVEEGGLRRERRRRKAVAVEHDAATAAADPEPLGQDDPAARGAECSTA